jgi:ferredoxin-NADP reductase
MLNTLCESDSQRETWLFYGVRNGEEHIMREHLVQLEAEHENVHLQVCYSNPRDGVDTDGTDYHHAERVSVELFKRVLPSNNYEYYICGPGPMMESMTNGLREWGVPDSDVHFEAFGPASVKKTAPAEKKAVPAGAAAIEIVFSKSGKTLKWDGSAESILELAENNGIDMDSGCRAGSCGTCITALKGGEVEYIEEPGALPEDSSCLACIAVPKNNLTLDA